MRKINVCFKHQHQNQMEKDASTEADSRWGEVWTWFWLVLQAFTYGLHLIGDGEQQQLRETHSLQNTHTLSLSVDRQEWGLWPVYANVLLLCSFSLRAVQYTALLVFTKPRGVWTHPPWGKGLRYLPDTTAVVHALTSSIQIAEELLSSLHFLLLLLLLLALVLLLLGLLSDGRFRSSSMCLCLGWCECWWVMWCYCFQLACVLIVWYLPFSRLYSILAILSNKMASSLANCESKAG